jgi:hypothetical protein
MRRRLEPKMIWKYVDDTGIDFEGTEMNIPGTGEE